MSSYFSSINVAASIAKLYVPILIETKVNEFAKVKTIESVSGATTSLNVVASQAIALNVWNKAGFYYGVFTASISLFNLIGSITGEKQLNDARRAMSKLYDSLCRNYSAYVSCHNKYTQYVKNDVNVINNVKSHFKEEVLVDVSKKLTDLGIDNIIGTYHIEHLDDNILRIDSCLKDVKSEMKNSMSLMKNIDSIFKSMIKKMDSKFLDFFCRGPIVDVIMNHSKAKLIKESVYEFEKSINVESEKMKADLERIAHFEIALTNVKKIFEDISDVLTPLIMNILIDVEKKYHDNVDEIPADILRALHTSCKILKGMAEKNILGNQRSKEATKDDVIKYSNDLSLKYNEIKETLLKVA
ncbi:MAG: hypothetical protein IKQ70_13320 [Bacteroidales bacterium]|nr:hypothetical protein [Bacteroidales bacterium]